MGVPHNLRGVVDFAALEVEGVLRVHVSRRLKATQDAQPNIKHKIVFLYSFGGSSTGFEVDEEESAIILENSFDFFAGVLSKNSLGIVYGLCVIGRFLVHKTHYVKFIAWYISYAIDCYI